eukprot:5603352-Lingulodinium_polyedra.AAC.1
MKSAAVPEHRNTHRPLPARRCRARRSVAHRFKRRLNTAARTLGGTRRRNRRNRVWTRRAVQPGTPVGFHRASRWRNRRAGS